MTNKHIVICSHGFGEKKDDRGLFPVVAEAIPECEFVMFDYNVESSEENTLTVSTFTEQEKRLRNKIEEVRKENPGATIDILAHSLGSVITGLVNDPSIRKTVLLAPPREFGTSKMMERYKANPLTREDPDGTAYLPRTNGSTTIVPAEFFREQKTLPPLPELYNSLRSAKNYILPAMQDDVLAEIDWKKENIPNIKLIELPGDHNFTGDDRPKLLETLREILQNE